MRTALLALPFLWILTPAPAEARHAAAPGAVHPHALAAADSAAVVATVGRFHGALAAGDTTAVLALLTPDAIVLENGVVETKEEYRAHHLPADIEFARAIASERTPVQVVVRGDVAWASGTSAARGEFRGRDVDAQGAELMVLTRTADGWRIAAIHWSSRARAS